MDEDKNDSQVIDESEQLDQSSSEQATDQGVDQVDTQDENEEADDQADGDDQGDEPDPQPEASRRENLRIQKLVSKLRQQPQQTASPLQQPQSAFDYRKELTADEEIYTQLESDRQNYGQANYTAGLEQAKSLQFVTRLEIDAPKVASKHKFMNQDDKQNFKPAVASAINEWYLQTTGYDPGDRQQGRSETVQNPDLRYGDFVDGIVELAEQIAGNRTASATKNIARQAATTGLRPDGSAAKSFDFSKAPEAMTDEELDAFISQSMPSRR